MGTKRFGKQNIYMLQYICVNKGNKKLDRYNKEDVDQEPPRRIRMYSVVDFEKQKTYILQSTDKSSESVLAQMMKLSDALTE